MVQLIHFHQMGHGHAVAAFALFAGAEIFYQRMPLEQVANGITQRARAFAVNNAHPG